MRLAPRGFVRSGRPPADGSGPPRGAPRRCPEGLLFSQAAAALTGVAFSTAAPVQRSPSLSDSGRDPLPPELDRCCVLLSGTKPEIL